MRSALKASDGDLIVFVDADVTNFGPHFVTGLLGPLLSDDSLTLVKGFYQRPLHGEPDGGGRVTELMAKPVIDLLFPYLASIEQPLAGETAAPRVGPGEVRPGRRLRRRAGPADRRRRPLRRRDHRPGGPRASGCTATGPCPSSGPRPPTSCGPPWPGPRWSPRTDSDPPGPTRR